MKNLTLSQNQYQALLVDLKTIIANSRKKAEEFARLQVILTYWDIGRKITKQAHDSKDSSLILDNLSGDLNLEKSILRRSVQFFNLYPKKPQDNTLSWSHYKSLLTIKNSNLRLELENKAKKGNWKIGKLVSAINILKDREQAIKNNQNSAISTNLENQIIMDPLNN